MYKQPYKIVNGKAISINKPIFPVWLNKEECETVKNLFSLIPNDDNLANIIRKINSADATKKIGSGRE